MAYYLTDYVLRKNGSQFWESQNEGPQLPSKIIFGGFGGSTPAKASIKNIKVGTTSFGSTDVWAPTISGSGSDSSSLVPPFDSNTGNYFGVVNDSANGFASGGELRVDCTPNVFHGVWLTKNLGSDYTKLYIQFEAKASNISDFCMLLSSTDYPLVTVSEAEFPGAISDVSFDLIEIAFTATLTPSIRFGYDGRNRVNATIKEAIAGNQYIMISSANITSPDDVATGTLLVSEAIDVAIDKSPGDNFTVGLQDIDGASILGIPILANVVLTKGTPGGQYSFDVDWNYDGDKTVTAEFLTEVGDTYHLSCTILRDSSVMRTGLSEPSFPTSTFEEEFDDGDYVGERWVQYWIRSNFSAPITYPHAGFPLIYKNGWLWYGTGSGNTASSEPPWTANPTIDGGWTWQRLYPITVWSSDTNIPSDTFRLVVPSTPNGFTYLYDNNDWESGDVSVAGDGTTKTLTLVFGLEPTETFSPLLSSDSIGPLSTRTFTAGEA